MSCYHATTVTRYDSKTDFDVCPYCVYSAAGEAFGTCPWRGYRAAVASPFGACRCCAFRHGRVADYSTILPLILLLTL